MQTDLSRLRAQLATAERERDEARRTAASYRISRDRLAHIVEHFGARRTGPPPRFAPDQDIAPDWLAREVRDLYNLQEATR